MQRDRVQKIQKIRVNMTVTGEPADWVQEWQERGLVRSVSDAVRQGLVVLRERFQSLDEQAIRLRTISESDEDR
jgi:Arc/MetJ-type ribon-helix-helix transcriptional regulator